MSYPTIELVSEPQVLGVIKEKGPVIPMDVRQVLKMGDSITIGATLSTLVSRGVLKVTHLKRGGSPFYYMPGQEERLIELSKFLPEKDRRTFDVLFQRKALRDKEQDPLTRVSLRSIPDFAIKINVEVGSEQEIFWRWFQITDDEAISIISKKQHAKPESEKTQTTSELLKDMAKDSKEDTKDNAKEVKEHVKESPNNALKVQELKSHELNTLDESKNNLNAQDDKEKTLKKQKQKDVQTEITLNNTSEQAFEPLQTNSAITNFNDAFINKCASALQALSIVIKDSKQIKKSVEYDLIVAIPTPFGGIEYFCKVKGKKKCNESDLSSAYLQGQGIRLPVLFLTTGVIAKKAKDKLKSDFKGMIVKEI